MFASPSMSSLGGASYLADRVAPLSDADSLETGFSANASPQSTLSDTSNPPSRPLSRPPSRPASRPATMAPSTRVGSGELAGIGSADRTFAGRRFFSARDGGYGGWGGGRGGVPPRRGGETHVSGDRMHALHAEATSTEAAATAPAPVAAPPYPTIMPRSNTGRTQIQIERREPPARLSATKRAARRIGRSLWGGG